MRLAKSYVAHVGTYKRTSQSQRKRSVKKSSMNKSKKRSYKPYNAQGR